MKLVNLASVFLVGALAACATIPTADPWISGQAAFEHGDYDLAMKDLSMAAREGHVAAYTLMGHLYRDGHGVARSGTKAARNYTRAAELGQCAAQRMTVEQIIEAGDLVEERRIGSRACADSVVSS